MGRKRAAALLAAAGLGAVLGALGAMGGPGGLRPAAGDTARYRTTVTLDGERLRVEGRRPKVAAVLLRARAMPRDGVLRSAVTGVVLDPLHDHGYVLVNGRPASVDTRLRSGSRVEVVHGVDQVERTGRREVVLAYPDQDKVGTTGWLPGVEGLAEEVYGVVSGEVVERRVLREPVPAREVIRPADVAAGSAVYLTFDDGPDPTWTPAVLDALRAVGAKATFCMVGRYVQAYPDLARRIVAEGHAVCNHTQNHARLDTLPAAAVEAEIAAATNTIVAVTGVRPTVFRVPYGRASPVVLDVVARLGLRNLGWTVDPSDYSRPGTDAIVDRVAQAVRPGSIVLLHDGGGDRAQTVAALARLLPALRGAGFTFGRP